MPEGHLVAVRIHRRGDRADLTGITDADAGRGHAHADLGVRAALAAQACGARPRREPRVTEPAARALPVVAGAALRGRTALDRWRATSDGRDVHTPALELRVEVRRHGHG